MYCWLNQVPSLNITHRTGNQSQRVSTDTAKFNLHIILCKKTHFKDKKKEAQKGQITSPKWHKSYLTETEVAQSARISTPALSSPGEAEF